MYASLMMSFGMLMLPFLLLTIISLLDRASDCYSNDRRKKMSLDISLISKKTITKSGTGVFIRDSGKTRELTVKEVKERWPEADEITAEEYTTNKVYTANITHNLTHMADVAGLYYPLWRPDEQGLDIASQLIEPLSKGLERLKAEPELFEAMNPENGWGDYDDLVDFVEEYLKACQKYPDATVEADR
jgi:hypothetical protein